MVVICECSFQFLTKQQLAEILAVRESEISILNCILFNVVFNT